MNDNIRLQIEKLGPIKNSEVEVGDLTLFMGPPNTGKSYALKALYSKLLPLDLYGFNIMTKIMKNEVVKFILKKYSEKLMELHDKLEDMIVKLLIILAISTARELDLRTLEEVLKSLKGDVIRDAIVLLRKEVVATTSTELTVESSELEKIKKKCVRAVVKDLLPVEDLKYSTLEPFDFERV